MSSIFFCVSALTCATASSHPPPAPAAPVDPVAEARLHTPPGFEQPGKPLVYEGENAAKLHVSIVDRATGKSTFCRVNVVGSDGNFYEPRQHALAPWSLHRAANRQGKGPFRYYGWFFYTSGAFTVEVPPGATRVEVWKGYECCPLTKTVDLVAGSASLELTLERSVPMAELGYYSGDTHLHLPRRNASDDDRNLDLLAAEDVQYGFALAANIDSRSYSGRMDRQSIPQQRGFGLASAIERDGYAIASGQEYLSSYGHICLLLHDRLVLEGLTVDPNRWPVLGLIGQETRKLGGHSFHAHGGYAQEIYIDFAQRATDGVELLQFAEYRGIALAGWYRILNIGYRFPAVGASDYPYCRALGDCRTYIHSPRRPSFAEWGRCAAEGRGFFTTGPLLVLEVDGHRPGDIIEKEVAGPHRIKLHARVVSLVSAVSAMEFIVNGQSLGREAISTDEGSGWFQSQQTIELTEPSWIAARAWSESPPGQPDADAHTNPVYVALDGKLPYREADLDWLIGKIDERIGEIGLRKFDEQAAVLAYFRASRTQLEQIRASGGQRLSQQP